MLHWEQQIELIKFLVGECVATSLVMGWFADEGCFILGRWCQHLVCGLDVLSRMSIYPSVSMTYHVARCSVRRDDLVIQVARHSASFWGRKGSFSFFLPPPLPPMMSALGSEYCGDFWCLLGTWHSRRLRGVEHLEEYIVMHVYFVTMGPMHWHIPIVFRAS